MIIFHAAKKCIQPQLDNLYNKEQRTYMVMSPRPSHPRWRAVFVVFFSKVWIPHESPPEVTKTATKVYGYRFPQPESPLKGTVAATSEAHYTTGRRPQKRASGEIITINVDVLLRQSLSQSFGCWRAFFGAEQNVRNLHSKRRLETGLQDCWSWLKPNLFF